MQSLNLILSVVYVLPIVNREIMKLYKKKLYRLCQITSSITEEIFIYNS